MFWTLPPRARANSNIAQALGKKDSLKIMINGEPGVFHWRLPGVTKANRFSWATEQPLLPRRAWKLQFYAPPEGVRYGLQSEQDSEGRGPIGLFWKYPEKLTETVKSGFLACFINRTKLAVQMWGSAVSKQWCNAVQTADSITMCSNDSSQNSDSDVFRRTWLNRPPFVWAVGGACRRATVNSWRWLL